MHELRTVLIGAGRGGSALIPLLLADEGIELVGVIDRRDDAAGLQLARSRDIATGTDVRRFLEDTEADLVIDATGDPTLLPGIGPFLRGAAVITGVAGRFMWKHLEAFEQIRDLNRRLERLVDDVRDVYIVVDDGRINFVNIAFTEVLGYNRHEAEGMPLEALITEHDRERVLGFHRARLSGATAPAQYTVEMIHRTGKVIPFEARVNTTTIDGKKVALLLLTNITERVTLEREREQFFRFMVHELRAPLSTVITFAKMLVDAQLADTMTTAQKEHILIRIAAGAERLLGIINDFLELSRFEHQKLQVNPEQIPLGDSVKQVLEDQGVLAKEKGLRVDDRTDHELKLFTEERILVTALQNLVNNAIKYSSEGTIRLDSKADTGEGMARIIVSDTGSGMTPEQCSAVFQEYGRLPEHKQILGTGLGLSLTRKLVEASGGRIWAESPGPRQGSTFTFTVPLPPPPAGPSPLANQPESEH